MSDPLSSFDPDRTAVHFGGEKIGFGRLSSDVSVLGAWLSDKKVAPGQSVGIFLRHPYWEWVAHLAAMRLGLTVATLTRRFRDEIDSVGGLDIWLGDSPGASKRPRIRQVIPFAPKDLSPLQVQFEISTKSLKRAAKQESDAHHRIMFTSGTTGGIKAVLWDEKMLAKRVEAARRSQGIRAETSLMMLLGIDTTAGFRYPLAVWRSGGSVHMRPPIFGTEESVLSFKSLAPTNLIVTSPNRLHDVVKAFHQPWPGRDDRKIVVAGGRLPVAVRDTTLKIACASVSIAYGATETGSITAGDSTLLDRHPGAVGFALEGAEVEIIDENGKAKAPGETGEVRTRTAYMVHSYRGTNETDGPFRDGWFYPGDEGVLFADGLLAIAGRLSETINLMGEKFSTTDLEARLATQVAVYGLAVGVFDQEETKVLGIAVVCEDHVNLRILEDHFRRHVPTGVNIRVVRLSNIPRNAMGKIARHELEKQLDEKLASKAQTVDE